MQDPNKKLVIVSACLAGLASRYDGRIISCPDCLNKLDDVHWIPLCPEQLGGLPTPRPAAQIVGGDGADVLAGSAQVLCVDDGRDLTQPFIDGARQVLDIARRQDVKTAYLKARSPSCGVTRYGVTAALLAAHGITLEEFG
jgi:uncharacterized protein YbbK (DUF523 family)